MNIKTQRTVILPFKEVEKAINTHLQDVNAGVVITLKDFSVDYFQDTLTFNIIETPNLDQPLNPVVNESNLK